MSRILNRGVLVPASSLQITGTPDGTKFLRDDGSWVSVGGGTGDVVGQASSVDSEVALFSGTGGKTIKRATGTGLLVLTSGVASTSTTSTAATVGTIELGAASDTTLSRASAGQLAVEGTNVLMNGGVLGTPSSGTLTNATGLPIAGLVASTSTAVGVGTVELGHATDTTLSRASAGQLAVEGVNVLMNGGALGTPSSGTLTNATGLPIAGLVASTSTAIGVGTLELGHASDTTLSRSAAGQLAIEGVDVLTTSNTKTLTNKTLTNPTITNYTESIVAIGNSSTSKTIDLTNGTVQTVTMTGNCTFTMPTAGGKSFTLYSNTGAGSFTATFTGVKWVGGVAPTATATASKVDVWTFSDDGTSWYGQVAKAFA